MLIRRLAFVSDMLDTRHGLFLADPLCEGADRRAQGEPALGQGIRPGVVTKRQPVEDTGGFEFAQPDGQHVRAEAEMALQVAVALRTIEQPLHDEQCPPCSDDLERRSQVGHGAGSGSGFIQ